MTDPTVGVDRGSTSRILKVEKPTRYLAFSSYGAEDIGPYIAGLGYSAPLGLNFEDQLDLVAVWAGPPASGGQELLAAGIGYRLALPDSGVTLFFNSDKSDVRLGAPANIALDITGQRINAAAGIRHQRDLSDGAKITTSLELSSISNRWQASGINVQDEELRIARAAVLYSAGLPFQFRKRFAVSVIKGFDRFGATPKSNPLASAPGVTSEFLRVAVGAEASIPLSKLFTVNLGLIGQFTNDSLPISQRCGTKTNEYTRGFDQGYVNGDRCWGGRLELAYNVMTPKPIPKGGIAFTQAYFGIDAGQVEDVPNPILPGNTDNWSSASLGVRTLYGEFIGEASVTRILDKPVGVIDQKDTRLWVRGTVRF